MNVSSLIVLAVIVYTVFAFCNARAGGRIDPSLSSFIFNGIGALIGVVAYAVQRYAFSATLIPAKSSGVAYSVVGGLAIGVFSIVFITIYGRGGHLSFVLPVVYGASIALGACVGFLFLGEPVSMMRVAGVAAIVGGIALLALA